MGGETVSDAPEPVVEDSAGGAGSEGGAGGLGGAEGDGSGGLEEA